MRYLHLIFIFLILTLGSLHTIIYQSVSATGDEIVSNTIEINNNTTNGPVLNDGDNFGSSIANIGDLNNDGISDIAVGAIGDDTGGTSRGAIHVMFMNSNGSVSNTIEINNNTANGPALNDGDNFGSSIANIGDLNNDGISDIAVGTFGDDTGGTSRGAIHVLFMNSNGTVSSTTKIDSNTTNGLALNDSDNFGSSIANIGDLNNDGISDIAVGATGDDTGGTSRGAIHVLFMNSNGSVSSTIEINNNTANGPALNDSDNFGSSIANIGDLNNDGISDIAVGTFGDDTGGISSGAIHVLFMNSNGSVSSTIKIDNNTVNGPVLNSLDNFGSSIANIGDLNNDGISDIAVGAFGEGVATIELGAIHVMFMNSNGSVSRTIKIDNNTTNGPVLNNLDASFGSSIANIGDLNNDGILDIAVGAINDDTDDTSRGTIHVMFMNSSTLLPAITNITSNATSSGTLKVGDTLLFTLTLALAENGATINGIYNSVPLSWNSIGNGTTYTATYTISEGDADQITALQITNVTIADSAGSTSLPFDGTDILNTIDANSPVITLDGTNPQTIELGDGYTELNATTNDGSTITINSANFTDLVGTYTIYYDSTDTAGNTAIQVNRTVNVVDTTPPVITLDGTNPQTIELGDGYTELNATTNDGSTITINSANFTDLVGTYTIYYDSTDTAGNTAIQVNRTVNVVDTTPPVITLDGTNPQTIELGDGYTELNATTNDGSTITINSANFTDAVGTYTIYYDSTDTAGNTAIQVNRTVNVVDTTPPVITLDGTNPQTIELGDGYTELNATTNDGSTITINSANFTDAVGTYTIYYDSTDTAGNNAIQVNRTVNVVDTTPPVITLDGTNPQTIELGDGYTELNATTNDGSPVTINSANFTDLVGTYTIYYDSTDTAGNNAIQVNRTVNVVDTTPPVITLDGTNPQTIELGDGYTELNATTNDGSPVFINSANFTDLVGTYTIYYDSTDTAGNNAIQVNRTVNVVDTTPPVITLDGTNPQTIELGDGYTELNATTNDGSPVFINLANFTDLVGTYTIYYDSTDTAGNTAIQVNRTVNVVDTTPPVITLDGTNPQTIELGDGYTELNATTNDGSPVFINSANFTDLVGTYTIYYDSTDTAGNNAIQVNRTVNVVDTTPPVITLDGTNPQTIELGDGYTELNATTNDGSPVFINLANFTDLVGTYTIYYDSTDTAGNTAIQVNRTVNVVDTTPPVITLDGTNPQTIELGDGYTELNATTNDGSPVFINSANFTDLVGTYTIYYDSTDTAGNNAIQVNRTVNVVDTTPPVITLDGTNPQTIELGDGYTELNATTNDGSPVTINSANFTDLVGTYTIYYDSTDTAGNNAIQVNRTVNVVDTTPPVITLDGTNPQTIELGDGYTELNATTNDGSPVTINSANFTDLVGTYTIYYDSTDTAGNNAIQVNRTVNVVDTTPPVITLDGTNPQTIELGDGYTELNATTNDGSPVFINSANFTDLVGTYTIYYDSTDTAGNNAIQVNRTVNVVDTTPPVITLDGTNPQTIELGDGYTELNATTNDGSPVFINLANFTDLVGTYTIYYDSTDTAGNNAIQVNRTVNVVDTTPPVITLDGTNPQTIELGDGYTELNATTNDGSPVFINLANFTDLVGTYTIYYDSTDTAGNTAIQVNRTVNVVDTTPPVITLDGTNPQTIELGDGYTELNATTNDGSPVFINSANFTDLVGTYTIYYDSTDTAGNNAIQVNRTVNVVDTTPPVITLDGTNPQTIELGDGYTELNATTNDGSPVFINSANFTDLVGTYTIYYDSTDTAGNTAIQVNRTVNVVDTTPPVITLDGTNPQTIELGDGYTELNATTNDGSPVFINSANFTDLVGTYTIYYDSTDTAGNTAIQVNRTVNVVDTTPPVITLDGTNPQTIELGDGYTELNATTNDGSPVFINSANFTDLVGTYTIYYDSTDTAGNTAIQVNRTVNVVDTTPPVITLDGTNPQTIEFGDGYIELNATTNDGSPVTINSANFTDAVGTYTIYYDSTDTAGNTAIQVNRTVNVVDTTPPVITLDGTNPQTIELGDGYTELNATTNDGSPVTINSANFTDLVGTYTIYYDSTDTAGNTAIQVNRTVNVADTTPPVITLDGTNPQTIEFGDGYTELDATTNDGSTITINSANFTDLVGTYTIYYDSTDTAGNTAIQVNRTVNVVDTTPPVITLDGTNPQTIEFGDGYTELDATTNDGSTITINSANFTDLVGTYTIYYDSTDTAGNTAIQVNRTVNVVDTTPPVITLDGTNPQTIEFGDGYTELDATTNDGSTITINSANFTDLVGTYTIYYDSTDTAGNTAIQVNRTVNVVDTTPPVITLDGTNPQTIEFGDGYTELDATTNDGSTITINSANFTDAVGTYTIYYDSTDTAGNTAIQVNRTVNVVDTTPPVITLDGTNPQTIEFGDGYTELDATTNDGSTITINSANFTDLVGTYTIYYDSTDTAGNTAIQVNRTVNVVDTTPPVITLDGTNPQTIEFGDGYTELDATTNDGSTITINSANFTDLVGTYTIYYDSTDTAGNTAIQVNRTVNVVDTTPPVITLDGTNPQTIEFGDGYTELDATTNDGSTITINSANFTDLVGTYTIYYDSTDTAGNTAIQVNRTVNVVDTTPPVITLDGTNPQTIEFGDGYTELDATTNDGSTITINSANFTDLVGTYTIYYDSTDTAGNTAIQVNRTVNVVDTTPPVITLDGTNPQTIEFGDGYTELDATTNDGSTITINSANFTDLVGTYTIYYDSTDTAGNTAIQVNRTVNVVDTTPPVITLDGTNPQTIEFGDGYTELDATTNDGSTITINSANFTDLVGTYTIYYDSTDTAGNTAIQVNRTVNVVDTTPPVITLDGTNPQTIEFGDGYTELDATTNDGSTITINSANFTDLVGTYTIYYDSTDTAGNTAIQVNRTVNVVDTTPPVITLDGTNPQTIEFGDGYTELDATTNDGSTITINSANFTDLVGTYTIYYDSTDTAGNTAIQVNRTVNVVDTTPPTLSSAVLNEGTGIFTITFSEIINASTINSTGFSIRDNNTSTGAVTLSTLELTTTTNGATISFNMTMANRQSVIAFNVSVLDISTGAVQDINGNAITLSANNIITTTSDNIPPVISLIGDNPQTIELGDGYTELDATTNDGSPVTINSANFTDAVGTYTIYYDSTDTAGNTAIQVNRTVNVVDTTPPVITLDGTNPQTIEFGDGYTELDATTNDGSPVTINSANFTDAVGTYTIYYDSTDTAGNTAIQVNRTVNVVDTTPPVITLDGTNPQTIEFGDGYTELDATTNDGSTITINSANFTDAVGTYYIYYDSTDTAGNTAIQVNRTVNVVDTTPPTLSSAVLNEGTGIFTITFSEIINASTINSTGFSIRDNNTSTGAVTLSTLELTTTTNGATISFNMTMANRQSVIAFNVSVLDISTGAVQDINGNAITLSANNIITTTSDNIPPVISLIGDNPQTIELGDGYTELDATTNDGSPVTINSANFTDLVGTYTIYYDSTDTAGNTAIQVNRTVNVVDTTPPVITLDGTNPQTIELGDGYTELDATTIDGSPVTINSANFTDAVGTYTIYYDSTDTAGNTAIQVNRTVNVVDTTPPVITLDGTNPQTIELGDGYTELDATTNDGSTITINSANFTDAVGTYYIYYDSTDTAGNTAIQVNRTVNVVDTTPPTLSSAVLNEGTGIFTITFSEIINASTINSTGFSIRDNNTSTGAVTLSTLELTTTTNGATISFNMTMANRQSVIAFNVSVLDISTGAVQDINGNAITMSANNIITTTSDSIPPVISLIGDNPQTIELGDGYTELNATTNDGSPVTINSANFTDAVGTYTIYYDSTDTAGNNAIQINRTVNVVDTTPPVISLIGGNPQTIEQGAGYTELNATTIDGSPVTINSANFTDAVGTYTIYYDSTDTAGNNAIQINRTVNVVDTTSPVISLIGDNPQTIEQGAGYTELNATTNDGSTITINSANFTDAVGTYTIYYDSTDTAGNTAIQVNRTVNVVDTTPPTLSSAVLNEGTGTFTITFSEIINASTINSTGFSIRDNNTSTGAVTLSTLELTTTTIGATISFNMTMANRQSVIAFNVSVLDISTGAVQDINGNAITMSANNIITTTSDSIPPVISLIGDNPQTIEQGAGYTELNATTNDGSPVTINSANFTDAVGTYTIYYDSTDTAGNTAIQVNRTVNVVDTTPPTLSSAVLNEGTGTFTITFSEIINASTINSTGFSIRDNNTSTGAVTLSNLELTTTANGATISFNMTMANRQSVIAFNVSVLDISTGAVQDINGNAITLSANNTITTTSDSIPPVISLIGDNPQTIEQGAGYTELNATTSDDSLVTINITEFADVVGTYSIYYDSTDTAGNTAIQVNRTVNVVDTTPPTLSSAVLNEGTGIFTITFSEIINASTINSTGFSIRDNNTSTGAVTLSTLELTTTTNGATISFNMTMANRQSVIAFNVSVLDISTGAVQDINGNAITMSANNTITTTSDTTPPVISLIGDNPQTIEQGAGYTELNATTNDGSPVTINSANFTDAVGTYTIYYDSTDTAGNNAIQINRTVNVVDTTPPTLSSAVLNEGTGTFTITFSEIINASTINSTGFSIRDNNNNTSTGAVTLSNLELTTTANGATISFNMTMANRQSVIAFNVSVLDISTGAVQDINGNAITLSANNTITPPLDTTPPVISLIGDNPQTIEQGAGYTELGATTNDGSTITINSANFTDAVGNYTIYYDSTDTAGNTAIQVNRTVSVVDTTPPTLSSAVLNEGTGTFTITFSEIINASTINSTGFSIRDNNNNTSTGAVTLSALELTTTANGATISFNMTMANRQSVIAFNVSVLDISTGAVQDINGNAITMSANNTITPPLDTIPPVISLIGDNPQTIEQGAGYTELGATTNDGSPVIINLANFTDIIGTYYIYYDSIDAFNNTAIQVNRTVNVVDTTPPTFSSAVLNEGTGTFTITFSEIINASTINSTGFSIRDNNNNTSTGAVTLSALELTTTANGATISFNMTLTNRQSVIAFNVSVLDISTGAVQDINGNAITMSANNTITTTSDTIPPVISLIGDNPQTIEQGAGYTELGATTNDGSPVIINLANFTDIIGTYYIYYDSIDAFNNTAIQVNRTVIVSDTTPPVITLNGANSQTIELGDGYTELGATTDDGSPVTINSVNFTDIVGTYTIYYDSVDASGNSAIQVNRTVIVSDTTPPDSCVIPDSGDWVITNSCTLDVSADAPGSVIVQNGSVLNIPSGITLDIDFTTFNLTVQSGGGVLIKSGGTLT